MDTTSINDLPGNKIKADLGETPDMNQMISSVQQASQGGVIELPQRDIPTDSTTSVIIDPESKQDFMQQPEKDYIQSFETNDQIIKDVQKKEKTELKRIELYDSIHMYVIMACVYFFFMLPFFHKNVMMKYLTFGLGNDGNLNLKGYLTKTLIFVTTCFSLIESINYLDRMSDI